MHNAPTDDNGGIATTHRAIRSFVRRQGRLTEGQQRALESQWDRLGLDLLGQPRDLDTLFGRRAEHVLEIGTGNGEALAWAAEHEPQREFIGIEVHQPGVGRLLASLAAKHLGNARLYCADAVEVLTQDIADHALDEVRIYFPDPWHKKRHHKRRLIQPAFVELLCRKLKSGGLLHLATDWEPYAQHMWDLLEAQGLLSNVNGPRGSAPRPAWRPETHFERRGQRLGHGVWDLLYRRND